MVNGPLGAFAPTMVSPKHESAIHVAFKTVVVVSMEIGKIGAFAPAAASTTCGVTQADSVDVCPMVPAKSAFDRPSFGGDHITNALPGRLSDRREETVQ